MRYNFLETLKAANYTTRTILVQVHHSQKYNKLQVKNLV